MAIRDAMFKTSNTIDNLVNDFSGLKGKFLFDKYVYFGDFPIPIPLLPNEKQKCQNAALKTSGKFFIGRKIASESDVKFPAVLQENDNKEMGSMISEAEGICDDVVTNEEYRGCGIAKYLVATCFQDVTVIGKDKKGLDVTENKHWIHASDQRNDVSKYCETVTHLRCMPLSGAPNAVVVCVSYLRAGSISGFDLLFTAPDSPIPTKMFHVFQLGETLENEFKANADKFIQDHGQVWFYCKCKETEKGNCMKMKK